MPEYIAVAPVDQVPADRGLSVVAGDRALALFQVDGQCYALDGRCPHRAGPLGEGILEKGRVYCPMHGWEFDVKTGACINRPDRAAACFPARVVAGMVEVYV